jgi:Uma2 family endonuclease
MASASLPEEPRTLGDLLADLGGINPRRVLLWPAPGKATEKHLIRLNDRKRRLYELVDGTLVEKVMGFPEALVALELGRLLGNHVEAHDLGVTAGADAALRILPGLVRLPDVCFLGWDRFPVRGQIPADPIAKLVPDLAVEVLSAGNTRGEMQRKLREYFLAGVRQVWFVDWEQRTVKVFTSPEEVRIVSEAQTLDGGAVVPGFLMSVQQIFARLPRQTRKRAPVRKKPGPGGKRSKKREAR